MIQTRCLFQPHQWKPRRAQTVEVYSDLAARKDLPADVHTRVLYVCERCGKLKTKKVKGDWTLKDVEP